VTFKIARRPSGARAAHRSTDLRVTGQQAPTAPS